jgi:hypothetical protein
MALVLDGTGSMTFGNGSITGLSTAAIPSTKIGAGAVLQVVQATKTDTYTTTTIGSQWISIPGQGGSGTFGATITPISASSKILVICFVPISFYTDAQVVRSQLQRNGSAIFTGDAAGSRPLGMGQHWGAAAAFGGQSAPVVFNVSGTYVDSPATTSAVTYSVAVGSDNTVGSGRVYVNLTHRDANNPGNDIRTASSIIAMEIAA